MHKRLSVKMLRALLLAGIILSLATAAPVPGTAAPATSVAEGSSTSAVFEYDREALPGATPWTSRDFRNDPQNFQFVIIGDRTGGADARGVFVRAMDQINLLQPEFVINVGDVIEGYSTDTEKLTEMWREADGIIERLEMPFFYTVGNHDMSNDVMKQMWLEKFGATYYHFVYGDVLFVVLNTEETPRAAPDGMEEKIELYNRLQVEDPAKANAMLEEFMKDEAVVAALGKRVDFGDQQIAYVERALAQNADVRWTFLFLHEPVWENPSEDFLAIEELLRDRNYTFVAGHLHYYNYDKRLGRDYITMGPAGASFHHEGPGNVDHILWLTMTESGPQIAKITLEGIYDRQGRDLQVKEMYERKGW